VPEREEDDVDEERQQDDRPAVVADVVVHPLERAQQRHDDHGEHAEIDGARKVAIDRAENVEVFRAGEELHRRVGPRRLNRERHQIPGGILRAVWRRDRYWRIGDLDWIGGERGNHEVVVVDAGVLILPVVGWLLRNVLGCQADDLARLEQDAFGFLDAPAQLRDVADRRAPHDRRGDRLVVLRDDRAKREDVRRRIEVEFLDHANAGAVAVLEAQIDGRRRRGAGRRSTDGVETLVRRCRGRLAACAQRERQWLRGQMFDELLRLFLLIQVALQTPAFQPRALVREDSDDIVGLHSDVTLA